MDPAHDIEMLKRKQFPFIIMGISGDQNKNQGACSENLSSSPTPKTVPDQPGNSKINYYSSSNSNEKTKSLTLPTSFRNPDTSVNVTAEATIPKAKQSRRPQHTPFTVPHVNVNFLESISSNGGTNQGQKPFRNSGNGNTITSPQSQMKLVGKEQQRGILRVLEDSSAKEQFELDSSTSSRTNGRNSVTSEKIEGTNIANSKNLKLCTGVNLNKSERDFYDFNDWTLQEKFDALFLKMREKEDEIFSLRAEVSDLKESIHKNSAETGASKNLYQHMQKQLETIEEKIELQQNDFVPPSFISDTATPASSRGSVSDSFVEFDYDKLIRSVKQLNMRVDNGHSMELCFTSGGATFKKWDGVKLTLFKNGLLLGVHKDFMPFTSSRAKMFVQDILDGFFPNEFQCLYPQGVYFAVKDLRTCNYNGDPNFSGEGHVLSDGPVRDCLPNLVPGSYVTTLKQRQFSVPAISNHDERLTSADSTKSAQSSSRSSCCSIKEADELPTLRASYEMLLTKRSRGYSDKMITVKLKNIINGHCYRLNTSIFARVSEIIDHLNNQIELGPCEEFKLIHCLPMGMLSVPSATLKDYGIEGNTVLYYRVDRM